MTRAGPVGSPSAQGPRALAPVPREIGSAGPSGGRTLVCVGGLHGNEPPGVLALQRVLERLEADPRWLVGRLVGLAGNREALTRGQRFLDEDMNRIWSLERVERVRAGIGLDAAEDLELRELADVLDRELARAPDATVLDLHSTSGAGSAFATLDDTLANRALAFALPVPHVLGLEEELSGTMLRYLNERGVPAIGFEAGQHLDPASVDRAEAAVWIAMEAVGVLERGARVEVERGRELLARGGRGELGAVEVRHRHPVAARDGFEMHPGFESFQRVRKGQVLARDVRGPIRCPEDGMLLMPLYQAQGQDGFFVIRSIHPIWLRLSAVLRRLRLERVVHWLPGVRRHPAEDRVFLVDRARARWLALQVFHLLGFRRRAVSGSVLELVPREPR